jgi:hypothetical protein
MKGAKTGGRKAGTPNKRSLECAAMLEANGFDPDLPWLYWARVLKSHLAPLSKRGPDKAETFYQGRLLVGIGEGAQKVEHIYARATADMADKAAKELARYIRPQLMRIQGTGSGGALVVEFAEDHRGLKGDGKSHAGHTGGALTARVTLPHIRKIKPL